jgi:hypothetical protein
MKSLLLPQKRDTYDTRTDTERFQTENLRPRRVIFPELEDAGVRSDLVHVSQAFEFNAARLGWLSFLHQVTQCLIQYADSGGGDMTVASHNTSNIYNFIRLISCRFTSVDSHQEICNSIERKLKASIVRNARLDRFHRTCYLGTRTELLDEIVSWITDDWNSSSHASRSIYFNKSSPEAKRCVCILGSPGSGKSTIAATIVSSLLRTIHERCPRLATAHYCIRRLDNSTMNANKILPTLAHELSLNSPRIAEYVNELLSSPFIAGLGTNITSQQQLLLYPVSKCRETVLVVIDAVDELSHPASFAANLSSLIPQLASNLRLIVTTRNENNVLLNIGHNLIAKVSLELHTDNSAETVRYYLEHALRDGIRMQFGTQKEWIAWPTDSQLDALAKKADGLFIWASTVVSFILPLIFKHGMARRDNVINGVIHGTDGLGDLSSLYLFILNQVLGENSPYTERLANMNRFIGFLAILEEPASLDTIKDFLSLTLPAFDSRRFLQLSRSLLVPGTEPITPSTMPQMHKTFADFITSDRAGIFRVVIADQHHDALVNSFIRIIHRLRSNTNKKAMAPNGTLPAGLVYSYNHWGYHIRNCDPKRALPIALFKEFINSHMPIWLRAHKVIARSLTRENHWQVLRENLYSLYLFVLNQALADKSVDADQLSNINRILGFLVIIKEPVSLGVIEDFLEPAVPRSNLRRFVKSTLNLLIPNIGVITHPTLLQLPSLFVDFIVSNRAGKFQIVVAKHHHTALVLAIETMTSNLHFGKKISSQVFNEGTFSLPSGLTYAYCRWGYHLKNCGMDTTLPIKLLEKFVKESIFTWLDVIITAGRYDTDNSIEDKLTEAAYLMALLSETLQGEDDTTLIRRYAEEAAILINDFLHRQRHGPEDTNSIVEPGFTQNTPSSYFPSHLNMLDRDHLSPKMRSSCMVEHYQAKYLTPSRVEEGENTVHHGKTLLRGMRAAKAG